MEFVKLRIEEEVAIVTIDRPKSMNALNNQVYEEIIANLEAVEKMDDVKVVILTGAGEKAFAAGADIAQMVNQDAMEGRYLGGLCHRSAYLLENMRQVTIAAVNGFALGGGCELAMACDCIVASAKAQFGQPEVKLGIMPGFAGTQRLPRRVGAAKAKELLFSGRTVPAGEAERIGLVTAVYEEGDFWEKTMEMARSFAANSKAAIGQVKYCVDRGVEMDFEAGCALETERFGWGFYHPDAKEGMTAFLEKRPPKFEA
jgi:enoyl-CoA hydratase